jgi:hypothetical protein
MLQVSAVLVVTRHQGQGHSFNRPYPGQLQRHGERLLLAPELLK